MSQMAKLAKKFLRSPGSLSYKDLQKLLIFIGFEKLEAKGSHVKFKHDILGLNIVIPVHNNDCKEFYKKQVAKQIKEFVKKIK